jgi:hypothetical protein
MLELYTGFVILSTRKDATGPIRELTCWTHLDLEEIEKLLPLKDSPAEI